MRHAREDYNKDKLNTIPEKEPVFLLRAQDQTAAMPVRYWALLQEMDNPLRDLAFKQAALMDKWPVKKKADL